MTVAVIVPLLLATGLGLLALGASLGIGPVQRPVPMTSHPRVQHVDAASAGRRRGRRRHPAPTVDDCIAALDHAARSLRSGSSPTMALSEALHTHPNVLVEVRRHLDRGGAIGSTTEQVRAGSAHERLVLHAVRVGRRAGGSGAGVLERAAETLREHQAWAHERRAQSAQARLSARVLTALPIVFACWSVATDDGVRRAYATSPLPALSATAGAALNLLGWWWMRRLTRGGP